MSEPSDPHDQPAAPGPEPCMPCRGTGTVISHLGGSPSRVSCPWCRGTGVRQPGLDAQRPGGDPEPPEAA